MICGLNLRLETKLMKVLSARLWMEKKLQFLHFLSIQKILDFLVSKKISSLLLIIIIFRLSAGKNAFCKTVQKALLMLFMMEVKLFIQIIKDTKVLLILLFKNWKLIGKIFLLINLFQNLWKNFLRHLSMTNLNLLNIITKIISNHCKMMGGMQELRAMMIG